MHDSGDMNQLGANAQDFLAAYRAQRPTPGAGSAWSNLAAVEARISTAEVALGSNAGDAGDTVDLRHTVDLGHTVGGTSLSRAAILGWLKPFGITVVLGMGGLGVASQVVGSPTELGPTEASPGAELQRASAELPMATTQARVPEPKPPRPHRIASSLPGLRPESSPGSESLPGPESSRESESSSVPGPERENVARKIPRRAKPTSRPSESGSADATSRLAAEVRLMERAKKAVAAKKWDEALSLLAEHSRDFPQGALAEDRQAFVVQSLCHQGKLEAGRKNLAAFSERFPRAPTLSRLRAACELSESAR